MDDLISRQAAIDTIDEERKQRHLFNTAEDGLLEARRIINTLTPVQPEPKEGHWIRTDCGLDVECKCSRCGYKDFVEPGDEYWFKRNYCPNCGAKMTISTK